MSLIKVGYFYYDTDEIVGICSKCNGHLYNAPYFLLTFDIPASLRQELITGETVIGYCPVCGTIQVIRRAIEVIR